MPDAEGFDIGPLIQAAADKYGLSCWLILGMLKAESGLAPDAERWGTLTREARAALAARDWAALQAIVEATWPDVSFGLGQMTVGTAEGYGIGDGSKTVANVLRVREMLLDRATNIDVCTRHLAGCWAAVESYPEREIMALRLYNGGGWGLTEDYARRFAAHIAAYREALAWAKEVISDV